MRRSAAALLSLILVCASAAPARADTANADAAAVDADGALDADAVDADAVDADDAEAASERPAAGPAADAPGAGGPGRTPDVLPQWGRGPFEVRDPFVLAMLRLSPWARSPEVLGHLDVQFGLRTVWANHYAFARDRLVIDAETREAALSLRVGLFDRVELGVWVPYLWRGGGVMDSFVEGFHDTFSLPGANRDRRPRDRYRVAGIESDGSAFELEHSGYGLGDVVLEGRALLSEGGALAPAAALTVRLRLPTARAKFDHSDGVDASVGLDLSKRLGEGPVVLYAGGAYTYAAEARVEDLELLRHRAFFYVGAEWELVGGVSLVAHAWVESRRERELFDDPAPPGVGEADLTFGNYVTYIAGGFKVEPISGLLLELGIIENLIDPETTADFGVLLNVVWEPFS